MMDAGLEGKPVFVAHSVTWSLSSEKIIEVIVEGLPTMYSDTVKVAEMDVIEKFAATICLTVEPKN